MSVMEVIEGSPASFSTPWTEVTTQVTSMNESWSGVGEELEYDYHFLTRTCLLGGLVVLSIIGNTLAIHKLASKRMRKKRTTALFLNLAVADCLVTIFPMAGQMIWEGLNRRWFGDVIFCKFFKFLQTFSLSSSNYMLVAIALDRHRAITRPLSPPGSPTPLLLSSWAVSLLPSLPCLHIFTVEVRPLAGSVGEQEECVSDFSAWSSLWRKAYFSGVAILVFFLPLLLFIGLYSHIVYELRAASLRILRTGSETSSTAAAPRQHLLSRARVKTTNLSMAVVVTFILTNLPYIVDECIRQRFVTKDQCNTLYCHVVKAFLGVSMVSNSAINPFIFLLFNSKSKFAQSCTFGCCPLTRRFQTNFSMVRVKFTSSSHSEPPPPIPMDQMALRPVECPYMPANTASPLLSECDCRGPTSHNHGCLHCHHCQCDSWKAVIRLGRQHGRLTPVSRDSLT